MSGQQKALVDLIISADADSMSKTERIWLAMMTAAYAGIAFRDVSIVAVAPSNSSLVRAEMPRDAAERVILGFQAQDPRLISFFDKFATPPGSVYAEHLAHEFESSPLGPDGGVKLIERCAPPRPTNRP